jgi:hypothetical protein
MTTQPVVPEAYGDCHLGKDRAFDSQARRCARTTQRYRTFPIWLLSQTKRNRRIAVTLALGHTNGALARHFKVSAGRIS